MLNKLTSRPVYAWYRRIILPIPALDAAKMMLPGIAIGAAASMALRDVFPTVLVLILSYVCVLLIGRHFSPYELKIPGESELRLAIELLDKTSLLTRRRNELIWDRRATNSFLSSKYDSMFLSKEKNYWLVRGRKFDIASLAAAINSSGITVTVY